WKFKHVDELAMRTEASRAAGRDLSWFFDEWLRRVGLIEYALGGWTAAPDGDGWISNVTVVRRGPYLHPMPVAIRTADGFTFGRSEPLRDPDTVRVRTRLKPLDVRLDPNHVTEDWWRFDDADVTAPWFDERTARVVFDWPLLHQWREDRFVTAFLPYGWYSDPGHFTPALRMSINYQGWLDRITLGLATPTAPGIRGRSHLQGWFTLHDPAVGAKISPQIGVSDWALDGIDKFVLDRTWNATPFVYANGPQRTVTLAFTSTIPYDPTFFDPTRWEGHTVLSVSGTGDLRTSLPDTVRLRAFLAGGFVSGTTRREGTSARMLPRRASGLRLMARMRLASVGSRATTRGRPSSGRCFCPPATRRKRSPTTSCVPKARRSPEATCTTPRSAAPACAATT